MVVSCRKEWEPCGRRACDYVVTVARSHMVFIPATGKKRSGSPRSWHKEDLVFDFQEDQFFYEVCMYVCMCV